MARLVRLYRMVERMDAAEARLASDAAERVTRVRAAEAVGAREQRELARAALGAGDRSGWLAAESAGEFAAVRVAGLAPLEAERKAALERALAVYRQSRMRTEQVERVEEKARREKAVEEARKSQAEADDRFGARLGWARTQPSMKAP